MQAKAAPEYNHLSMAYSLCLNFSLTKQPTFCNTTNSFLMKLCLRKEHKHSIVIGHATSENLLQPIKSTTQFRVVGWWHIVISMEFLHLFPRHRFAGKLLVKLQRVSCFLSLFKGDHKGQHNCCLL